jgi:hypothetical protein
MKCYLCGQPQNDFSDPLTDDHVPPKNLFHVIDPARMGGDLITVKAHRSCNQGHQMDDEYLRFITVTPSTNVSPVAKIVWEKVLRSIKRPQSKGFLTHIQKRLEVREVQTTAGIYLGKRPGFEIDGQRTATILFRICRGLFFHETGNILPHDCPNSVFPSEVFKQLRKKGEAAGEFKVVCNGVFKYLWRAETPNQINGYFWLVFYDHVEFVIATGSKATKPGIR